ncbi:MAG TPA: SGNH/GDSL hydrolase family protein [Clostridiales bacterium]|nr:SGNH/GDSL hydrolase family protein [Clostridiales bacterium]
MNNDVKLFGSLYGLNDAWVSWLKGEKFPIAFYGDSTVDGNNTTGWIGNKLGADSTSPNAFSEKLEIKLREAANNSILRIYNAGFSGQISSWALANYDNVFGETSAYNDVKMVGIGFGINDRLVYQDEKSYRDGFKNNIKGIIGKCYASNIQPFLITTQATVEPGVRTDFTTRYPLRTSQHINTIANEVKKELSIEYGLELLDINSYTEDFLLYSSYSLETIISDRLHFNDVGHEYEAGLLFALINPQTIFADGFHKIDYSNQRIAKGVPEDWLTMPTAVKDNFKVYIDYTKSDMADMNIMTVYVFNKSKRKLNLKAYKNHETTKTYVKIDGEVKSLTGVETDLGELELGLHKFEVFTGTSNIADFKGFLLVML